MAEKQVEIHDEGKVYPVERGSYLFDKPRYFPLRPETRIVHTTLDLM